MIYEIEFTTSAAKEFRKLTPAIRKRLAIAIQKLAANPRIGAVRPMVSNKSWRLRVGDYRVVYDIQDEKLVVLILRVRHRRDVYKD